MRYGIFKLSLFIFLLSGCSTPGTTDTSFREELSTKRNWDEETTRKFIERKIALGMTKEQVLYLQGSPLHWTKYPTSDGVFESWSYPFPQNRFQSTFDFKDGILIGYSGSGRYTGKEIEDVRDFKK